MEDVKLTISNVLEYIKNVPEEKMIKCLTANSDGVCCFLGHVALMKGVNVRSTAGALNDPEIEELDKKITNFVSIAHGESIQYSYIINDGPTVNGYKELTPKARMLHVLKDMKAAGIE